MRLSAFQLTACTWRLGQDVPTARGTYSLRAGHLLALADGEGRVGLGEATPLAAPEGEGPLRAAVAALGGRALPETVEQVEALVVRALPPSLPASRAALELALLDLLAQAQRLPLHRLLSAQSRPTVALNALLTAQPPRALADEGRERVAEGYGTLKVKLGIGPLAADVERLGTLRAAVGTGVRVRADANGAWDVGAARVALAAFAPFGLELLEQPVPAEDVAGLGRLRGPGQVPLAADEALSSPERAQAVLLGEQGPAVDVVVLKPTVLGGLLPALRLARAAQEQGVTAYATHALEGPVARAGAAQLAAALPAERHASGVEVDVAHRAHWERHGYRVERGALALPAGPGLGLSLEGLS